MTRSPLRLDPDEPVVATDLVDAPCAAARASSSARRRGRVLARAAVGVAAMRRRRSDDDAAGATDSGDETDGDAIGTGDPTPASAAAKKLGPPRRLDHDDPLRLWIGGDSLAGSFGPALGQTGSARPASSTTTIDYKVSSGLEDQGIRNWHRARATEQMADNDPDAVVFIIGTNDASIVEHATTANDDGVPDWEADYRDKVDRMMEILVGGTRHRTVLLARSADPRRPDPRTRAPTSSAGHARGGSASTRPTSCTSTRTSLFADENGDYSRSLPDDERRGDQQMRISDGVHFSVDGAEYLADKLWKLLDKRWHITAAGRPVAADRLHDRRGQQRLRARASARYRPTVPSQSSSAHDARRRRTPRQRSPPRPRRRCRRTKPRRRRRNRRRRRPPPATDDDDADDEAVDADPTP